MNTVSLGHPLSSEGEDVVSLGLLNPSPNPNPNPNPSPSRTFAESKSSPSERVSTGSFDSSDSSSSFSSSPPSSSSFSSSSGQFKKSSSCNDLLKELGYEVLSEPVRHARCNSWTMSDSLELGCMFESPSNNLPLASFNHISREVVSLEKARYFYVNILGFQIIPRPPFDSPGYWLYGYGLSVHLIQSTRLAEWKQQVFKRISQSSQYLPRVDHIAFITHGMDHIRDILVKANIYYKYDEPKGTGIRQIFLFDPDGNVIEVSNCQPPVGLVKCIQTSSNDYSLGWLNSDIATLTLSESLKKRASGYGDESNDGSRDASSLNNSSSGRRSTELFVNPDLASSIALLATLDAQLKALENERDAAKEKAMQLQAEVDRLKEVLAEKDN